jgi:hypothetical protein
MYQNTNYHIFDYDSYAVIWKAIDVIDNKFVKCFNFNMGPCNSYWNTDELDNLSVEEQNELVTMLQKIK